MSQPTETQARFRALPRGNTKSRRVQVSGASRPLTPREASLLEAGRAIVAEGGFPTPRGLADRLGVSLGVVYGYVRQLRVEGVWDLPWRGEPKHVGRRKGSQSPPRRPIDSDEARATIRAALAARRARLGQAQEGSSP